MKQQTLPGVIELAAMFTKINIDIAERNKGLKNPEEGESVVDLTDEEYYAEQIGNIFDCDTELANKAAHAMAQYIQDLKSVIIKNHDL